MAGKEASTGKVAGQLVPFVDPIPEGLDKPRRRSVRQIVRAMVMAGAQLANCHKALKPLE